MTSTSHEDQQAVTAVRDGDAERYRELVERHERRVYAMAWSRLGDAALADHVTLLQNEHARRLAMKTRMKFFHVFTVRRLQHSRRQAVEPLAERTLVVARGCVGTHVGPAGIDG